MSNRSVPVIDIMALIDSDAAARAAVVRQIGLACREWGFFQVTGHGIPEALIDRVLSETQGFFALPNTVKESVSRTKKNSRGYYNRELTKNIRDMKEVFDFGHKPHQELPDDDPANMTRDGYNQWPDPVICSNFESTMKEYFRACEAVALRLLEAIADGLGVEPGRLTRDFAERSTSFLRLNYYPSHDPLTTVDHKQSAAATGHLGVHHHTDAGAITLLLQDMVAGLQVCRDGEWFTVEPVSGALVINIGDIVQVWTNDLYRAPLHRVLASTDRDRYSLPFFYNPSYDTDYSPLDAVTGGAPPKYTPINWGEFRLRRQQGDYADYGHEVQISDFQI